MIETSLIVRSVDQFRNVETEVGVFDGCVVQTKHSKNAHDIGMGEAAVKVAQSDLACSNPLHVVPEASKSRHQGRTHRALVL